MKIVREIITHAHTRAMLLVSELLWGSTSKKAITRWSFNRGPLRA